MECAILNRNDFLEVISTWNSIYVSNYMHYDIQRRDDSSNDWKKGLLKVVSVLDVIDDVKGTPVELLLNKAIKNAKQMDDSRIQSVHELLHTVEKYMNEEASV